jgi:hypothetical protein
MNGGDFRMMFDTATKSPPPVGQISVALPRCKLQFSVAHIAQFGR